MNITRSQLAQVIAEEVRLRLQELHEFVLEAEDDDQPEEEPKGGGKKSKGPSKHDVVSADGEEPADNGEHGGPEANTGSPDASTPDSDEDDAHTGPAVDGDEPDPEAIDPKGTDGEEGGGKVNDFASGKTIQSISIEPRSKILPGAREVTLTFNETTQPIKMLVTPTGAIKWMLNGALYDLP